MADNRIKYGLRWSTAANGGKACPNPIECFVASAQAFAGSAALGAGDVVTRLAGGGVKDTTAGDPIFGVVVGVGHYWDGQKMAIQPTVPSGTTYGTVLERQTKVMVVPIDAGRWEADCDDAVTATTEAAYQALIGENTDLAFPGGTVNNVARLDPKCDISLHGTATAQMRIMGISKTRDNEDFSGANVKLILEANEVATQLPWGGATGV